jgi:hypothetical protein
MGRPTTPNYRTPYRTLSFTITADQAVYYLLRMGKERPKHVDVLNKITTISDIKLDIYIIL